MGVEVAVDDDGDDCDDGEVEGEAGRVTLTNEASYRDAGR